MSVSSSSDSVNTQTSAQSSNLPIDFGEKIKNIVNEKDLQVVIKSQNEMLKRLEKSNQMLENCNNVCETQQGKILDKFRKHTTMLVEMKQDLNIIFTRIRKIKEAVNNKKPEVWLVIEPDSKPENNSNNDADLKQNNDNLPSTSQTSINNLESNNLIDFRDEI